MKDIVRAGVLWGYTQLTQFLGHDADKLLEEAGLSRADLDNQDTYLSRTAVSTLLERSAKQMDCPDIGLRLAGMQDIYILGALGFAVRNAADVRSSIATAARFIHYQAPRATVTLEPAKGGASEQILFRAPTLDGGSRQLAEHAVGLFCRIYRQLTENRAMPSQVSFAHSAGAPAAVYKEHLGVAPEFDAPTHAVGMARATLALPLQGANRHLQTVIENYLEIYAPRTEGSIERQTHEALTQLMRSGPANIEDVADMLRMHPRTLQRRLKEEDATFERIRDDVRKSIAELHLANSTLPFAELAHLLGYANQSALTRSCMRWFGEPPSAVRRRLRAQIA